MMVAQSQPIQDKTGAPAAAKPQQPGATTPGNPVAATPATPATAPATPAPDGTTASASSKDAQAAPAKPMTAAATAALLDSAVKTIQDYVQPQQTASIQVDQATGQTYVRISDPQTQQTILQIPPEQVLAMAQKLQQLASSKAASGGLVDQQG
jgi:flagellar protein FlaG